MTVHKGSSRVIAMIVLAGLVQQLSAQMLRGEPIEDGGPPPPTFKPTVRPTAPTVKPTVAPAMDYSCVHADAWLVNVNGVYSSNYGATVDITTSGFVNTTTSTTGWKVTFNGIPYYDHVFTQSEINTLNSRPKASTDFISGSTTAVAGQFYNFGDNIGYTTAKCEDGFWPPGPGCPVEYDGTVTVPVYPSPEYKSGGCYLTYHIGYFVNGVPFWSWSDATSYADEDVWHNLAMSFEQYDMDVCVGHSGSNVYHHHSVSPCLMAQLNDTGDGHSPVHGFALDGYPIYGPYQAAGTLATSCWQARDYSSSATGCSGGQRTCLLVNSYNYKLGTTTATSAGPDLGGMVETQSKNYISSNSGIYYEDMFYNQTCTNRGGQYLDSYNGHTHGSYGYHYHLTMDSTGTPTFPYTMGPKFYGCQVSGICQTGLTSGSGTSICTNTATRNPGACTTSKAFPGVPYPTVSPTAAPVTRRPSYKPTIVPSAVPSRSQTPTRWPSLRPSFTPTVKPTDGPTEGPTATPTAVPTADPTEVPTAVPTADPTAVPTHVPTTDPTFDPTAVPTAVPTATPSAVPTESPTAVPTAVPSAVPTGAPSEAPSQNPSAVPTAIPTAVPTAVPSIASTGNPTYLPTPIPVISPTRKPSALSSTLTMKPSVVSTNGPVVTVPSLKPTVAGTKTRQPVTTSGSGDHVVDPTMIPTDKPVKRYTLRFPTFKPTGNPARIPTLKPSQAKKPHKPSAK